jgi:hypothetical protein
LIHDPPSCILTPTPNTTFLFLFHAPHPTVLQANAELLPDIIVGGAEEEAALRRLEAAIAAEADVLRQQIQSRAPVDGGGDAAADDGEEAIYAMASASVMSKRRAAIPQFNLSQQAEIPLSRHVESAATLAEAKVPPLPLPNPVVVGATPTCRVTPLLQSQEALKSAGFKERGGGGGGGGMGHVEDLRDGCAMLSPSSARFKKSSKKMAEKMAGGGSGGWLKSMATKVIFCCCCCRLHYLYSLSSCTRSAPFSPVKTRTPLQPVHRLHHTLLPTTMASTSMSLHSTAKAKKAVVPWEETKSKNVSAHLASSYPRPHPPLPWLLSIPAPLAAAALWCRVLQ